MNSISPSTAQGIAETPASGPVPLASRWVRAGAWPLTARVERIARRLAHPELKPDPLAVWQGTLAEGAAIGRDARPRPILTAKYRDELTYWRRVADGEEPSFEGSFHEVFGRWQRTRLFELGGRLGLDRPFPPGEVISGELAEWCARTRALEIGGGPHPAVCEARWKSAVAVDPLAAGYAAEGLLPGGQSDRVVHLPAVGEAIPLPSASIDLVIAENCLDHVVDPWKVLSEIMRLLVPGGHLWLLVDLMHHRDHLHPHPFTEASARSMFDKARLRVVKADVWESHSHPNAFGQLRTLLVKPKR